MLTLYLGQFGARDLAAEAALIEALAAFPSPRQLVLSADAEFTQRAAPRATIIARPEQAAAAAPDRAIICGPFIAPGPFEQALSLAAALQQQGKPTLIHNLGLPHRPAFSEIAERHNATLGACHAVSCRDNGTMELAGQWGRNSLPGLSSYPERMMVPDDYLLSRLHAGKLLGVSIAFTPGAVAAWEANAAAIAALLPTGPDWSVVPLISSMARLAAGETDATGCQKFLARFLPAQPVLLRDSLDFNWWRANVTPQRLKALVARCDLVFAQRELPVAFAAACGVPVIGARLPEDERVMRACATLASSLAPGSRCLRL